MLNDGIQLFSIVPTLDTLIWKKKFDGRKKAHSRLIENKPHNSF